MATRSDGAEEARAHLPDLLDQAHHGRTTVITRRGKPYAALVPVGELAARTKGPSLVALAGSGAGLWGKRVRATLRRMRSEWD